MRFHLSRFLLNLALIVIFAKAINYLQNVKPDSLGQIQHVFFMQDKNQLFFTSKQHSIVGYIQIQTGEVDRIYAYSPKDKLIRINKQNEVVQFLGQENKIYFFNFKSETKHFLDQKYVIKEKIKSFSSIQLQNQLYILQNERLTFYNDSNLGGKEIYLIGQNQKLFEIIQFQQTQSVILLHSKIEPQENSHGLVNLLCLRKYQFAQLKNNNCFRARDINVQKAYRNQNYIQIQTMTQNYIAHGFAGALIKFQGKPIQSFDQEVVLDGFKSYRMLSKAYYDYLVVQSPNCNENNFKLLDKGKTWGLYNDNTFLRKFKKQSQHKPYRSWIHKLKQPTSIFLVYQRTDNEILFYQFSDQNPYLQGSTQPEKWRIKGIKIENATKDESNLNSNDL